MNEFDLIKDIWQSQPERKLAAEEILKQVKRSKNRLANKLLFEVFVMIIPRIIKRIVKYLSPHKIYMSGKRTLLIGAGAGGKLVLDEIRNNPDILNNPIAFVDDDDVKTKILLFLSSK